MPLLLGIMLLVIVGNDYLFSQCRAHSESENMNYTSWLIGKYFLYMGGGNQSFLLLIFLFFLARLIFRAGSDGLYFTR